MPDRTPHNKPTTIPILVGVTIGNLILCSLLLPWDTNGEGQACYHEDDDSSYDHGLFAHTVPFVSLM